MNLIQKAKEEVTALVEQAAAAAMAAEALPHAEGIVSIVEIPKEVSFGDYSTNYAMAAARAMHMAPRKIADTLCRYLKLEGSYFSGVSVAGAGFMNFTLGAKWYADVLRAIETEGAEFPRSHEQHEKIMVEFVSANPTGPMHMGNARGGVLGDCLAEVLSWVGNDVHREFLVNNAGNQVNLFGRSLEARYFQQFPETADYPFPDDGYHGDDIKVLAQRFYEETGETYRNCSSEDRRSAMVQFGLKNNIAKMKADLQRYRIDYDRWFLETELHEAGKVQETVDILTAKGLTYEKDDALWFKTTEFGCPKDDVLRRSNGYFTYYAVDIAYHRNKFLERKFDRNINIWGADHHGQVGRLKAAMQALDIDPERLEVVLMQLVRLMQGGEVVRMSKRTGKAIALCDLLDEISVDAARFFFNSRQAETQMDFDLDLAVRSDSENPVYYVQYAHARICSLIRTLAAEGVTLDAADTLDLSCLNAPEEMALIKALALMPDEILSAANSRDPSKINKYLVLVAAAFHRFYNAVHIKGAGEPYEKARLKLAACTRDILAIGLKLIRVDAPEKM